MGKSVKESLIQVENLEYTAYGTNIKARLIYGWRLFMIGLTIINFTTCVIACVCAGYCYHKINVINSVTPSSPPPSSSSGAASATAEALAASVITTAAPIIPGHEHEHFKEYVVIDDDYLEYYDSDDDDDDYYDSSDDDDYSDGDDDYSDGDDDYSDDDDDNSDNIDDDDNDYRDNEHDDYNGDNDDDNDDDSANIPNDSLMSTDASGDGNNDLENDTELDDSSQTTQSNKRSKRSTGTEKCQSMCQKKKENRRAKCVKKCINRKTRGQNKLKEKAAPKPVQIQLQAAHFEASMSDAVVQQSVGGRYNQFGRTELCKYLDKLEGTLCLNRTFIPKKSHEPLRIFSKSSWYDEERSPVTFDNSIATVKSSGIFLVYAQAYIGGRSTSKSIMLVHKRNNNIIGSLRCVNGVNIDNDSTQQQSCSITGLMNLESSDTLEVQTSTPTEHITLNNHMTYFGLVQVSKFDTSSEDQTSKKRHN